MVQDGVFDVQVLSLYHVVQDVLDLILMLVEQWKLGFVLHVERAHGDVREHG